jgi:hypothetical protein
MISHNLLISHKNGSYILTTFFLPEPISGVISVHLLGDIGAFALGS